MIFEILDFVVWLVGVLLIIIVSPKEELGIIVSIVRVIIWSMICIVLLLVIDIDMSSIFGEIKIVWTK